jgi:hypothetical protein
MSIYHEETILIHFDKSGRARTVDKTLAHGSGEPGFNSLPRTSSFFVNFNKNLGLAYGLC